MSTSTDSLRFRSIEYLKGSGPSEFTVSAFTANRNTAWDGREAVLFLSQPSNGGASGLSGSSTSADFQFADTTTWYYNPDFPQRYTGDLPLGYTVDSRNPAWLPAEFETGGASGGIPSFITASTSPAGNLQPVISLADIRSILAWIEGGDGIEGYDECLRSSLITERYYRDWETYSGRPYERPRELREISSGIGANAIIHDYGSIRSAKYNNPYLTGPDATLFLAQNIDDDTLSTNGYFERLATARPLPTRTYKFVSHEQGHYEMPCAFKPGYWGLEFLITVTAPSGTLHEMFFDPVGSGNAVFADRRNGVLEPRGFTGVGGSSASIDEIAWESGTVTVGVTPHDALNGHALDVIELDGSISLSLDVADATVDQAQDTLSWSVRSQPWEDGDLLMIRIRES